MEWKVESVALNMMVRAGWKRDSLKPGDAVSVTGHPGKNGKSAMLLVKVLLPDGQEFPPLMMASLVNLSDRRALSRVEMGPARRPSSCSSPADACLREGQAGRASNNGDSSWPDISGVWFMHGKLVPSLSLSTRFPFCPPEPKDSKRASRKLILSCTAFPAACRESGDSAPFEIIPIPGRMLIYYEYQHLVRQIHMDRSDSPADFIPTWMGDSIGKWEGDTLVVDTVGFVDKTRLDIVGLPHSDALHVVERMRRVSHDVLQVDITVDDPKMYAKPLTAQRIFDFKPGWEIGEWVCEENNTYMKFSDQNPGQNSDQNPARNSDQNKPAK